jgi:poly(hydroxyalkanoate) depolymerase family esterase
MSRRYRSLIATIVVGISFVSERASAATLQKLDQSTWWQSVTNLPSYVNMYLYAPDQLAAQPPIVVAPHHCQGDGPGTYSEMSSLVSLADQNGFIMIFPEATGQNCWDAGSDRSLMHDGGGDTQAIVQMVRYVLSTYDGNAERVYSVGGSSGGIMTEALLGVYPDVFRAGVSLMGVPCGCWAEDYNDVVGKPSDGTGQWSGPCSGGSVDKTPEQWGALVRSYFPEYAGHRPRLQHWHGTADTTLSYNNLAEDIDEWTNLLGLKAMPDGSDMPASGTTRQFWTNQCGYVVYETFSLSGVAHAVPFDGNAVAAYFGLDDVDSPDPEAVACPEATPASTEPSASGGAPPTTPAASSTAAPQTPASSAGAGGGPGGVGAGGAGSNDANPTAGLGGANGGGAGGFTMAPAQTAGGSVNLPTAQPASSAAGPQTPSAAPASSPSGPAQSTPQVQSGDAPSAAAPAALGAEPQASVTSTPNTGSEQASGCAYARGERPAPGLPLASLAALLGLIGGRRAGLGRSKSRRSRRP